MRILYLHQYFVPPDGPGITRSYEFARRLKSYGHDVLLITSTGMLPSQYQYIKKTTRVEIAGIELVVIPVPYSNEMTFSQRTRAFFQFALLASWEAMRNHADVIFATSTPLTIAIPGVIGKLWQRKPMVFEVRDLWPELPIQVGALRNPIARFVAYLLEWFAYHAANHLIALSPGIAEGIMRTGIPASKISLIYNCCDLDKFDIPAACGADTRAELGLTPDQPLVLYAGTFGLLNSVEYLVNLAAETRKLAPEIAFLLVGAGKKYEHVENRARELGLLNQVVFFRSSIPKEEIPNVFAAATVSTVLFQPIDSMWRTNSANKFFDGLAASKPVVINYRSGWQADVLNETGAGITLDPTDYQAAARELIAFLKDPARLNRAGAAAHDLAMTRYDRDDMTEKLEQVLTQIAGFPSLVEDQREDAHVGS